MKIILTLLSLLILGSCQTTAPSITRDIHTGDTVTRAATVTVHSGLLSALYATPVHSLKTGYLIEMAYNNTGIGWQFFNQAYSFGKQYEFVSTGRDTALCGGAGGCAVIERGFIIMNAADFKKAAKSGFEFKLVGSKGSIEGKVPARAFQDVLDLKAAQ